MTTAQLAFDIDSLLHDLEVEAAPEWTGAPLRYHEEYRTPDELDAAWDRWIFENGSFGCIPYSHMWHRDRHRDGFEFEPKPSTNHHQCAIFTADASCNGAHAATRDHDHTNAELPGHHMTQIICEPCGWHVIDRSETTAVESWHDHALPGWRELPVVPLKLVDARHSDRGAQRLINWIEENYPVDWQLPGHPIITDRTQSGTRHVPGRSPWGGYDLSHTALR